MCYSVSIEIRKTTKLAWRNHNDQRECSEAVWWLIVIVVVFVNAVRKMVLSVGLVVVGYVSW